MGAGSSKPPCSQLWGDLSMAQRETPLCGLAVQPPGMWFSWPRGGQCTHQAPPGAPAQVCAYGEPVSAEHMCPLILHALRCCPFCISVSSNLFTPLTTGGGRTAVIPILQRRKLRPAKGATCPGHTGSQLGPQPRQSGSGATLSAPPPLLASLVLLRLILSGARSSRGLRRLGADIWGLPPARAVAAMCPP